MADTSKTYLSVIIHFILPHKKKKKKKSCYLSSIHLICKLCPIMTYLLGIPFIDCFSQNNIPRVAVLRYTWYT